MTLEATTTAATPAATPTVQEVNIPAQATEALPVETPKPEEKQDPYHNQFLKLQKREKEILRRQQEYKKQWEELSQHQKDLDEYRSLKEKAKVDPLALSRHFGINYNELTAQILNDERPTPEMQIKALQDRLDQLQGESSKRQQQEEAAKAQAQIDSFKSDMVKYMEEQGEKYELIRNFNAYDQVINEVYAHWKETGEYLNVDEVADEIESRMELEARRLLTLKKLSPKEAAKVADALEQKEDTKTEAPKPKVESPGTLTNSMQAQMPPVRRMQYDYRDDEARLKAAIALIKDK